MGEAWRQLLPEGGDADADFLKLSLHGIEALEQQRDGIGRLNFVPPKRLGRVSRLAQAVAIALLLVTAPQIGARADQAPVVAPLPMSTAKAPQQCCRICRKGQPCGDRCISAERQCRTEPGCACSAASGS